MTKAGMLISDTEIITRVGGVDAWEILNALDADPVTAKYDAIFGGKRFRPAVEKALEARAEHRTKAAG